MLLYSIRIICLINLQPEILKNLIFTMIFFHEITIYGAFVLQPNYFNGTTTRRKYHEINRPLFSFRIFILQFVVMFPGDVFQYLRKCGLEFFGCGHEIFHEFFGSGSMSIDDIGNDFHAQEWYIV